MFKLLKNLIGSKIIGIDLGTTNSCVSVIEGGKPKTLPNREGKYTTPSIVAFAKTGEVLVGDPALRQMVTNPAKTFYSVKRFIGTMFKERKTEAFAVPYIVRPDQDEKTSIEIDGKLWYPEQISAEVLKYMKTCAEDYLGQTVTEAVITVPAYFTELQRQATIAAGRIAGLDVKKIINEPTSAALAYGLEMNENIKTVAVYDFGGGTFDFSICKIEENEIKVLASGGDNHLGGDNIDELLLTKCIARFQSENGIDLTKVPEAMARLKVACESAKIELSSAKQTSINLPFLAVGPSCPFHFQTDISRDEFEKLISSVVDRTITAMRDVMDKSGLKISEIDEILLVGGSTRIPLVQRRLEEYFKKTLTK
ncbi:MAG: Hsp70 family protein, partial [Oligoflexales bacterium]|nr:Hsp70 family protein [Oligoflexales bacterium]